MSANPNRIITLQELINAQVDAYKLELIMNEAPWVEVTTRLGRKCYSIATIQGIIEQFQIDTQKELDNLQDAIAKIVQGSVPDLAVTTWSGRTQEQKNKENPSPFDFKAKGDGVSNDTQSFTELEKTYQGQIIDLLGKTYVVNKTPFKNQYVNGLFKIGTQTVVPNKQSFNNNPLPFALNPVVNDSASGLLWGWYLTSTWLTGQDSNAVQTFAVDEKNRLIYCMYTTGAYNTSTVLYAIPMDRGSGFNSPVWGADADRRIGHQGIGVENNKDGGTYIWVTKQTNTGLPETIDPQAGCKVIRFRVDNVPSYSTAGSAVNEWSGRNGLYFEGVQDFQLWESVNTTQNAQATISHDQKYLLTKMNVGDSHYRIRVFELQTLVNGGAGDYSNKYIHEFTVPTVTTDPDKGVGIQDMACDGKHIYFYAGRYPASDGAVINLTVHDMMGNFVDTVKVGDIGLYDTINYPRPNVDGLGDTSETEGITIATINGKPTVLIHFVGGTSGYKTSLVYSLGLKQLNARGDENTPALMVDNHKGGLALGFPRNNRVIKFGSIDVNGMQNANVQFYNGNMYLGGTVNSTTFSQIPMLSLPSVGNASVNIFGGLSHYRGDDSSAPVRHIVLKSRSTDMINQKALEHNDYLWEIQASGDDGSKLLTESRVGVVGGSITFRVDGTVSTGYMPTRMHFSTASETEVITRRYSISPMGDFEPAANNRYSIGGASRSVKEIHLANTPIVSSDERLKQKFRTLHEAEKSAALEIKKSICMYKFNDAVEIKGDGARWHCGVKAQEVVAIMQKHELNPFDYAFICYDEWNEQDEIIEAWNDEYDDDGNLIREAGSEIIQEYRAAGDRYAVRYNELAMFILATI